MPRKMSGRAAFAATVLTVSCALTTAWSSAPAEAASGSGSCGSSGGSSGGGSGSGGDYQIWQALSTHQDMCSGGGNASATDGTGGSALHIPCWWGPEYSPGGLQGYVDSLGGSAIDTQFALMNEYDSNGDNAPFTAGYQSTSGPKWESYNIGAAPAGEWYGLILNNGDTTDQIDACMAAEDARYPEFFYWGVNGNPPADLPGGAPGFSPRDLAEYIESVIVLPGADVRSSQRGGTRATVGLPIWYWQDLDTSHTHVGVYACAFGVCVTFDARAVSFSIDSGASRSESRTWSGGCTEQSGTNTLGPTYSGQPASQNPSCGVMYSALLHDVVPTVYTTWHVSISWPGGSWGPPSDPVIPTALPPFSVQDIQAYNEPSPSTKP